MVPVLAQITAAVCQFLTDPVQVVRFAHCDVCKWTPSVNDEGGGIAFFFRSARKGSNLAGRFRVQEPVIAINGATITSHFATKIDDVIALLAPAPSGGRQSCLLTGLMAVNGIAACVGNDLLSLRARTAMSCTLPVL